MPRDMDRPKEIKFTIDGRPFTVTDDTHKAADLLRLAGLDPSTHDLGKVRHGQGGTKRFQDNQTVHIKDGDKFVTIRQCAEVA
jgi:hypothetical protein